MDILYKFVEGALAPHTKAASGLLPDKKRDLGTLNIATIRLNSLETGSTPRHRVFSFPLKG